MQIRPATPADTEAMLAVARRLPQWFTQAGCEQMSRDFLVHHGAVAIVDDQVAGFVTWWPADEPGAMDMTWLGVDPGLRGGGIGRRLVVTMLDASRAAGAHTAVVSTLAATCDYPPYAETRAFYHALGFTDVRVDANHYGPDEDRLLLAKAL